MLILYFGMAHNLCLIGVFSVVYIEHIHRQDLVNQTISNSTELFRRGNNVFLKLFFHNSLYIQ